jgi:hypothetical protein
MRLDYLIIYLFVLYFLLKLFRSVSTNHHDNNIMDQINYNSTLFGKFLGTLPTEIGLLSSLTKL